MADVLTPAERACLVEVLVYHQRVEDPPYTGVCACGWGVLGASHAEHVVEVFETSAAERLEARPR
jgi:hypothetical protein